jgi:hypothetical protein
MLFFYLPGLPWNQFLRYSLLYRSSYAMVCIVFRFLKTFNKMKGLRHQLE